MSSERLVNGVVDNLEDHVVQTSAVISVSDVHSWALSHGLKPLQELDVFSTVSHDYFVPDFICLF